MHKELERLKTLLEMGMTEKGTTEREIIREKFVKSMNILAGEMGGVQHRDDEELAEQLIETNEQLVELEKQLEVAGEQLDEAHQKIAKLEETNTSLVEKNKELKAKLKEKK